MSLNRKSIADTVTKISAPFKRLENNPQGRAVILGTAGTIMTTAAISIGARAALGTVDGVHNDITNLVNSVGALLNAGHEQTAISVSDLKDGVFTISHNDNNHSHSQQGADSLVGVAHAASSEYVQANLNDLYKAHDGITANAIGAQLDAAKNASDQNTAISHVYQAFDKAIGYYTIREVPGDTSVADLLPKQPGIDFDGNRQLFLQGIMREILAGDLPRPENPNQVFEIINDKIAANGRNIGEVNFLGQGNLADSSEGSMQKIKVEAMAGAVADYISKSDNSVNAVALQREMVANLRVQGADVVPDNAIAVKSEYQFAPVGQGAIETPVTPPKEPETPVVTDKTPPTYNTEDVRNLINNYSNVETNRINDMLATADKTGNLALKGQAVAEYMYHQETMFGRSGFADAVVNNMDSTYRNSLGLGNLDSVDVKTSNIIASLTQKEASTLNIQTEGANIHSVADIDKRLEQMGINIGSKEIAPNSAANIAKDAGMSGTPAYTLVQKAADSVGAETGLTKEDIIAIAQDKKEGTIPVVALDPVKEPEKPVQLGGSPDSNFDLRLLGLLALIPAVFGIKKWRDKQKSGQQNAGKSIG